MVLEKFFKVTEFYLESGKIDILKKSQGKLKQFNGDTADLILLKTGTNMWVHCDLNEFIMVNEQMEEQATTRPDILHFFGQEKFIFFREKPGNLEKLCLWQPCVHAQYFYVPMK